MKINARLRRELETTTRYEANRSITTSASPHGTRPNQRELTAAQRQARRVSTRRGNIGGVPESNVTAFATATTRTTVSRTYGSVGKPQFESMAGTRGGGAARTRQTGHGRMQRATKQRGEKSEAQRGVWRVARAFWRGCESRLPACLPACLAAGTPAGR